ncbi:hypothetical protein ACFO26_10505 [Lactococcus nasutitermitis]|uniref:Phage protein n=1 Tax=Lactococcus nasutitermitis TaxID=1652957 RepID=A0ABV9JG20_9LACT|nr:hypothetical protein [Lactococcus nasutitermitis]
MKAEYKGEKVEVWKISDNTLEDEWVRKAFDVGKIRWLKFDDTRLQVMERKNQVPYYGTMGEWLVFDAQNDDYSIVNTYVFPQRYEVLEDK